MKFRFSFNASYSAILKIALVIAPTIAVCAENGNAPLNYFLHSYGPASIPTMYLAWVFTALSVAILVIVTTLLIIAIFRKRPLENTYLINYEDQENKGKLWVYIGTGISTCILFILAIYSLFTLNLTAKPSQAPALTLIVTGYDWWWKVEYEDADPARRFITANEIHIPVGLPVLVKLKSADVIHAFWVPMLAGKTQMIPGLINQQWLQADTEGIYLGQCTQYCGLQHAHMRLAIIAENATKFRQWQEAQLRTPEISAEMNTHTGRTVFRDRCGGCHTVRGTEFMGTHAPDLTHLNSRQLIAAGLLTNTPEHIMQWITHAQELKPGTRMPSMRLTAHETTALSTFLSTLN